MGRYLLKLFICYKQNLFILFFLLYFKTFMGLSPHFYLWQILLNLFLSKDFFKEHPQLFFPINSCGWGQTEQGDSSRGSLLTSGLEKSQRCGLWGSDITLGTRDPLHWWSRIDSQRPRWSLYRCAGRHYCSISKMVAPKGQRGWEFRMLGLYFHFPEPRSSSKRAVIVPPVSIVEQET